LEAQGQLSFQEKEAARRRPLRFDDVAD